MNRKALTMAPIELEATFANIKIRASLYAVCTFKSLTSIPTPLRDAMKQFSIKQTNAISCHNL